MNNSVYINHYSPSFLFDDYIESSSAAKTWKYWCEKNNCDLIFELPKKLDSIDKLAIISSDVFVHWECPDFFSLVDSIGVVRETDDFAKIHNLVKNTNIFSGDYVITDFIVLSKENFDLIPLNNIEFNEKISSREVNYLPTAYNTTDPIRKDFFSHNWQLEDKTTFLFKYSYIWNLKNMKIDMIENIYNAVSGAYA